MTLSMFHICKKRLLLYYITYTEVKRFKVKKKKVEKTGEERWRREEKGKAREEKKENKNAHTCMLLPQSTTFPFVA